MISIEAYFKQQLAKAFAAGSEWCKQNTRLVLDGKRCYISQPEEWQAKLYAEKDYATKED